MPRRRELSTGSAPRPGDGRAVESSTYTLAVLTPTYLESTFTELENVLAEHLGLEERERD